MFFFKQLQCVGTEVSKGQNKTSFKIVQKTFEAEREKCKLLFTQKLGIISSSNDVYAHLHL